MITITNFSGMTPAVTPKRLPEGMAEVAVNCDFSRGDLRPMRANVSDGVHTGGLPRSVYLHRHGDVRYWYRLPYRASFAAGLIPEDAFLGDGNPVFWTVDEVRDPAWPRLTTSNHQGNPGQSTPLTTFRLGVPTPGPPLASAGAAELTDDSQGVGYRMWAYTLVNSWGQEGPMSLPSAPVLTASPPNVTISGLNSWSLGTGQGAFRAIVKKRVYRAVTGVSQQTYWQFAGETTGANFLDNKTDANLGDECPTRSFVHPKELLKGLTAMPNGILAAFRGHDIWFCHPYHPYAWPEEYVLTASFRISALASMGGSNLLVGTRGHPYICTGADPLGMSLSRLDISQSCIDIFVSSAAFPYTRATMTSLGVFGAAYASPDGLVIVPASGSASLATQDVFDQAQWRWMTSGDVRGFAHEGEYVCCCRVASDAGTVPSGLEGVMARMPAHLGRKQFTMIFDIAGKRARFSDFYADTGHADLQDDALYFAEASGSGWRVVRWNPPKGSPLRYYWRSKPILVPRTNYGTLRVIADDLATTGQAYANANLAMKVLVDGEERFSSPIWGFGPWRMPSGFTGREWVIILEGTAPVQSVIIGGEE